GRSGDGHDRGISPRCLPVPHRPEPPGAAPSGRDLVGELLVDVIARFSKDVRSSIVSERRASADPENKPNARSSLNKGVPIYEQVSARRVGLRHLREKNAAIPAIP